MASRRANAPVFYTMADFRRTDRSLLKKTARKTTQEYTEGLTPEESARQWAVGGSAREKEEEAKTGNTG